VATDRGSDASASVLNDVVNLKTVNVFGIGADRATRAPERGGEITDEMTAPMARGMRVVGSDDQARILQGRKRPLLRVQGHRQEIDVASDRPAQLLAVQCRARRPAARVSDAVASAIHRLASRANLAQSPD